MTCLLPEPSPSLRYRKVNPEDVNPEAIARCLFVLSLPLGFLRPHVNPPIHESQVANSECGLTLESTERTSLISCTHSSLKFICFYL